MSGTADVVTNDGPLHTEDGSIITTHVVSTSATGNDFDGTWSDSGSTTVIGTDSHILTSDGVMHSDDQSTSVSTVVSSSATGNDLLGTWGDSGST